MRQESALYGRARCVPPPAAFASSGFIEHFVWARTMRRLRLTDTLRGIPPAALLKSVLLVLPAAKNLPFRPKGGRSARLCSILCPQSALFFPSRRPARAAPEAASLPRPAGTASASAVCGRPPDRRRRAPAAQGTRRPNEAPRACPPSGSGAPFMAAHVYEAGTRALTSRRAPPASA